MNSHIIKDNWKQLAGKVKGQWGKLTDDEILQTKGDLEVLQGKLEEKYGYSKDKAKAEVDRFFEKY